MVNIFYGISMLKYRLGASINYVRVRRGGEVLRFVISAKIGGGGFRKL